MLTAYINAAMRIAGYELLDGGEGYIGKIPGLQGVWANSDRERVETSYVKY
jgi:hypothetical protein